MEVPFDYGDGILCNKQSCECYAQEELDFCVKSIHYATSTIKQYKKMRFINKNTLKYHKTKNQKEFE